MGGYCRITSIQHLHKTTCWSWCQVSLFSWRNNFFVNSNFSSVFWQEWFTGKSSCASVSLHCLAWSWGSRNHWPPHQLQALGAWIHEAEATIFSNLSSLQVQIQYLYRHLSMILCSCAWGTMSGCLARLLMGTAAFKIIKSGSELGSDSAICGMTIGIQPTHLWKAWYQSNIQEVNRTQGTDNLLAFTLSEQEKLFYIDYIWPLDFCSFLLHSQKGASGPFVFTFK